MSAPSLRAFLGTVAVAVVLWRVSAASVHAEAVASPRFKAIAFDYFVLFNPDSVVSAPFNVLLCSGTSQNIQRL